ncbi:hypothetical protein FRC12_008520 [Ceratobasidium sp. 428]|nr:hypothetical protein FRC12_008520 [Ceratobasidium sp. 428]
MSYLINSIQIHRKYDTQFLIDDSGSMAGSRWIEARDALMGVAREALRYDADGIEVYFLNAEQKGRTVKNEDDVKELFDSVRPASGTPTGERLEQILASYILRLEDAKANGVKAKAGLGDEKMKAGLGDAKARLEDEKIKPLNVIVITDGEPSDDPESVIIAAARRLDAGRFPLAQVGIQFIQVGDDRRARKALERLDEELGRMHDIRDIVDTRPYTGSKLTSDLLIAMLLGGVNKRVDKVKNVEGVRRM